MALNVWENTFLSAKSRDKNKISKKDWLISKFNKYLLYVCYIPGQGLQTPSTHRNQARRCWYKRCRALSVLFIHSEAQFCCVKKNNRMHVRCRVIELSAQSQGWWLCRSAEDMSIEYVSHLPDTRSATQLLAHTVSIRCILQFFKKLWNVMGNLFRNICWKLFRLLFLHNRLT